MLYETIKVNGVWLPKPDQDLEVVADKVKKEFQTEAGTTVIKVIRESRLSLSGSWTLTGDWVERFRRWRQADTVVVSAYYPNPDRLDDYRCQFEIESEKHVTDARQQLPQTKGIYKISVRITEL